MTLTYQIHLNKKEKNKDLLYINLCRQMMYQNDYNVVPSELTIKNSDDIKKYIDPQLWAQRIGLVKFDITLDGKDLPYYIKNDTDTLKQMYLSDLKISLEDGSFVKPITTDLLLFVMPAKSELSGTIKFIKGSGIENGKFLSYAGFGYEATDSVCKILVDSPYDLTKKIPPLVEQIDLLLQRKIQ